VGVDEDAARRAVQGARVARLATSSAAGVVHLVPITFALERAPGDRLVTAVDHKPKTTMQLRRLDDIRANPDVGVLVDHYDDEDWSRLWWVRLRGRARVVEGGAEHEAAVDALVAKYRQYQRQRPVGPAIVMEIFRWQWWRAADVERF
jgi:PPOX class probable F420-dependent enzyme